MLAELAINQSITIYFLSNNKILQCITVYASAQKAAREALCSLNWLPKQTKEHKNTNMNTNRKGEETGRNKQ